MAAAVTVGVSSLLPPADLSCSMTEFQMDLRLLLRRLDTSGGRLTSKDDAASFAAFSMRLSKACCFRACACCVRIRRSGVATWRKKPPSCDALRLGGGGGALGLRAFLWI